MGEIIGAVIGALSWAGEAALTGLAAISPSGGVAGGVATVATTAASIGGTVASLAQGSPSMPRQGMVMPDNRAAEQAAFAEAELMRKRKGMASTMLTGPGGMTSQPTTLKSQLGA